MKTKTKVFVSGVTGFLGSHTTIQLLNKGYAVIGTLRSMQRANEIKAVIAKQADVSHLSFAEADLIDAESWQKAMNGQNIDYVMHIASPVPVALPKHEDDVIVPAKQGTLHVLQAASQHGVKRVILTSSMAAIAYNNDDSDQPKDETHWTDPTNKKETTPYIRSKAIAEKAAWDFIENDDSGMELTTVNPAAILGPVLEKDYGSSAEIVKKMMDGSFPAIPKIGFPVVDVRSVADLHILAMESDKSPGERFLAGGEFYWLKDIATVLKDKYPKRRIPKMVMPSFLVRIYAWFDRDLTGVIKELNKQRRVDSSKAKNLLGWKPIHEKQAILDCAESLIEKGIL